MAPAGCAYAIVAVALGGPPADAVNTGAAATIFGFCSAYAVSF